MARGRLNPIRVPIHFVEPAKRISSWEEYSQLYTKEEAIAEAQRCVQCAKPWCTLACPILQDARGYVIQVSEGDFDGAVETILKDNMLASCLGKVCYSYCEDACVVGKKGEPVAIRHLKWAALAYGGGDAQTYKPQGKKEGSVAVIGAGPAGLAAAQHLAERGYEVTVFEGSHKLGGLVTQTIPTYRLSAETFEEDMRRMEPLGIEFRLGVNVGTDITLEELRDGYDAVFVGIGTHSPGYLNLPGKDLPGVDIALDFLKRVMDGERPEVGKRVATIGGGDVAIDCSRTVLRMGASDSIILYRRTREEMPAADEEIEDALKEGVDIRFLVSPMEFQGEERVKAVLCQKMRLGEPDESGRRRPVAVEGDTEVVPVDTVIVAIGQTAELETFPGLGLELSRDGSMMADDENGRTDVEGVWAGGGPSIVHAHAAGTKAAQDIVRYLEEKPKVTTRVSRK